MQKNIKKSLSYFLGLILMLGANPVFSATLSVKLAGRILLQVESKGEAWYVEPETGLRYYLGRPSDAFNLMRRLGKGISNTNLEKIPVGTDISYGIDSDQEGLGDALENALGTDPVRNDSDGDGHDDKVEIDGGFNPLGSGNMGFDLKLVQKLSGMIFLQVEKKGEAWYVNPVNKKRYYLGRPADAFAVMRLLGLGISNTDLNKIIQANVPEAVIADLTKRLFDEVNKERVKTGLLPLKQNDSLSQVARTQSQSLADENAAFAGIGRACDYPMIHHENIKIGFMNTDRLAENKVYNYSQTGENIALYSASTYKVSYEAGDPVALEISKCTTERDKLGTSFKTRLDSAQEEADKKAVIQEEIVRRQKLFDQATKLDIIGLVPYQNDYLAAEITKGWMESKGHRENILHAEYDEAGMGVVIMNGYAYATQVFIKRADCGYETGQCCEKTGYYPYCFEGLSCGEGTCGG